MTEQVYEIELKGCSPEPLSHYLKALGILRLVTEQKDPSCRGFWRNDTFVLRSTLSKEELVRFFLNEYAPSPVLLPWNSTFCEYLLTKEWVPSESENILFLISTITRENPRFGKIIEVMDLSEEILKRLLKNEIEQLKRDFREEIEQLAQASNLSKEEKENLIKKIKKPLKGAIDSYKSKIFTTLRARAPEIFVSWLDGIAGLLFVKEELELKFFPLLGTGGNDGRLDFSDSFLEKVNGELAEQKNKPNTEKNIRNALFGDDTNTLSNSTFGQFNPFAVGNVNATVGLESKNHTNPWDYILALEGTFAFSGAAVRKYENKSSSLSMSFPFTTSHVPAGYGSSENSFSPSHEVTNETWFPTWEHPASFKEIKLLFSEGRVEFGNRSPANALAFAHGVASLGVDRNLTTFHRYAFLERNGQAHFAVKLGAFSPQESSDIMLFQEITDWVVSYIKRAPNSKNAVIKELQEALFSFSQRKSYAPSDLVDFLILFGRFVREEVKRNTYYIPHKRVLVKEWYEKANDGSVEFRLASSLASLLSHDIFIQRFDGKGREYFLEWLRFSGDCVRHLNLLMQKRLLLLTKDAKRAHTHHTYQESPSVYCSLTDVACFIDGLIDEKKLIDLTSALVFLEWNGRKIADDSPVVVRKLQKEDISVSAGYALTKLCFTNYTKNEVRLTPVIHQLLVAGDGERALRTALWRLRSSAYDIPEYRGLNIPRGLCSRIGAALVFPIGRGSVTFLEKMVGVKEERMV